jgi:hypothetical protein
MEDTKLKNLENAILWHRQLVYASSLTLSEMKEKNLLKGLENCCFDKVTFF